MEKFVNDLFKNIFCLFIWIEKFIFLFKISLIAFLDQTIMSYNVKLPAKHAAINFFSFIKLLDPNLYHPKVFII